MFNFKSFKNNVSKYETKLQKDLHGRKIRNLETLEIYPDALFFGYITVESQELHLEYHKFVSTIVAFPLRGSCMLLVISYTAEHCPL